MADETDADVAPPVRKPAGIGRYFSLVLLILLMEGVTAYWILDRAVPAPELPPTEELVEVEKKDEVWVPPLYFSDFVEMVVEPTAFRGNRIVQISLVLEVDAQAVVDELTVRKTVIWDLILRRLERLIEADFRDPKKEKLKSDLIQQINAALKNPGVVNVYITHLIMQ